MIRADYINNYAWPGKYVPELAEVIYDKNKDHNNDNLSPHINLKGILVIIKTFDSHNYLTLLSKPRI